MANESHVKLTINFNDPQADDEERETEALRLLNELRDMDEVEAADRVADPNPPEGNKAIGGMLIGLLTAEVSTANIRNLMGFLGQRLADKSIELEVEANGKKLKVKASSQAELEAAIAEAQKFVAS